MKRLNMFKQGLLEGFKCNENNDWKGDKNNAANGGIHVPVIHPDAVNATVVTFLCAGISTLFLVVYLFWSR